MNLWEGEMFRFQLAFLCFLGLSCVVVAQGQAKPPQTKIFSNEETRMKTLKELYAGLEGNWKGSYSLWLRPGTPAQESEINASLQTTFHVAERRYAPLRALLDEMMQLDPSYKWKLVGAPGNEVVVIQPRADSVLGWRVAPICDAKTVREVFAGKFAEALSQHGIFVVQFENLPNTPLNLCQRGLTAEDALNLTVRAVGTGLAWTLGGTKGLRFLTFWSGHMDLGLGDTQLERHAGKKTTPPRKPLLILHFMAGEGNKMLAASRTVGAFPLCAEPGGRAETARVRLQKGQILKWSDPRTFVYQFGEAEVRAEKTEHEVILLEFKDHKFVSVRSAKRKFVPGERLELIAYAAEGYVNARYQGEYLQIFGEDLKILRFPDEEVWVRISSSGGKSGWISLDNDIIRVTLVTF